MSATTDELREEVRRRYAESARAVSEGSGCGCGRGECCTEGGSDGASFVDAFYDAEQRGALPDAAVLASLGCGNPTRSPSCTRERSCSTSAPVAAST